MRLLSNGFQDRRLKPLGHLSKLIIIQFLATITGFQDRPVMTASVPLPLKKIGDPSAIRTRDTLIKSQVLYRLS